MTGRAPKTAFNRYHADVMAKHRGLSKKSSSAKPV